MKVIIVIITVYYYSDSRACRSLSVGFLLFFSQKSSLCVSVESLSLPRHMFSVMIIFVEYFHSIANTVELQWLEHLWDHENMLEVG